MKKRVLFLSCMLLLSSLCSCSNSSSFSIKEGDLIYENKLVYDRSSQEYDIGYKIEIKNKAKIESIKLGRIEAEKNEYGYKNGILSLKGSFLKKLSTQEKDLIVTLNDKTNIKIPTIIATKIIRTAEEFQNINDNLTGIYVLGNDIDLSSISNFEPLGTYFSEQDTANSYFHGILDGNGYSVKNAKVWYNNTASTNLNVYNGNFLFTSDAHKNGDNIGLFQIIGSSGVVRNVVFDNISVRGRTIVGTIAGNVMGTVENCIVTSTCSVEGGTHYYDDDCNIGGAFGIVAGSGIVRNVVSETINVSFPDIYMDYSDDYIGKIGNGADHTSEEGNTDPSWKYWNVDKPLMNYDDNGKATDSGKKAKDSNGQLTNGIYSFAGKTWGSISSCYSASWKQTPYEGSMREVEFSQTHLGSNKPSSGASDMGSITNCAALPITDLKNPDLYSDFDTYYWSFESNKFPTLNHYINSYSFTK